MRLLATTAIAATALAAGASAQTVSIGTNPQGSLAYATGAGVAKVAIEDAGVKMRVVPQGGPVVTLPLLNDGELDFTISVSVVTAFAKSGGAMFKGRKQENVRVVASLFPLVVGWYVRDDSPIKTLGDLRGKRVPSRYTKQKIAGLFARALLATAGVDAKRTSRACRCPTACAGCRTSWRARSTPPTSRCPRARPARRMPPSAGFGCSRRR